MNVLVLASQSPRRRELIKYLDRPFRTCSVDLPEIVRENETPEQVVLALAFEKAFAASKECMPEEVIIGCDTIVAVHGEIFGKPDDSESARRMLRALSGKKHEVYTGMAVIHEASKTKVVDFTVSSVWFRELTEEQIEWYVNTGEPIDKAGAYAIQGFGAKLIDKMAGDYFSIVGMSVSHLDKILSRYAL